MSERFMRVADEIVLPEKRLDLARRRFGEDFWTELEALKDPTIWHCLGFPINEDPNVEITSAIVNGCSTTITLSYYQKTVLNLGLHRDEDSYLRRNIAEITLDQS